MRLKTGTFTLFTSLGHSELNVMFYMISGDFTHKVFHRTFWKQLCDPAY